jgi:NADPH:quinone reductase
MLIIEVGEFGGPDVLVPRPVPEPVPGPGQVVVRVAAADVLFVDTLIRSGLGVDFFPIRPPYVPGNGVAGLVTATGDGADPSWAGRAVVAHLRRLAATALAAAAAGRIRPVIGQTFPLGRAADAHAALAARTAIAKTLLLT